VPGVLELLQIPCAGTGAQGLLLSQDQVLAKRVLRDAGVRVPRFLEVPLKGKSALEVLPLPVVVKPRFGGAPDVLARTRPQLAHGIGRVHAELGQPAVCEERARGRELSVGLLGNGRPAALPIGERTSGPGWTRAELPPRIRTRLVRLARAVHRELGLRDYGRVDFRLTPDEEIVFLGADAALPMPGDSLAAFALWSSIDYPELLRRICAFALRRQAVRRQARITPRPGSSPRR
jgi:D-alanine-D-alanine ligase